MVSTRIKRFKKISLVFITILFIIGIACCIISVASPNTEKLLTLNNTFTLKIPKNFTYSKTEYALSNEVSQHYVLIGKDNYKNINGFIQVRNQSTSLAEYLKQSEKNFSASVYEYEKKPALQNGSTGFDITFKIKGSDYDTQVMQTLWQRDNTLYVISTSARIEKNNSEILEKTFNELKDSVTLSGDSLPSGKLTEYCIHHI